MKTKKEFINDIYFECKAAIDDDSTQEVSNEEGKTLFTFYLDEGNETIKVRIDGEYKDLLNELDEETAFRYAKDICENYLYMIPEDIFDERVDNLEKGISAWYELTGKVMDDVKAWFKDHPNDVVDIDLPNDMYFIIALERKVIFKYVTTGKDGKILVGVSEPVYHDDQIFDWYEHDIDFEYVLQDAITVSDLMHEFYENTREA